MTAGEFGPGEWVVERMNGPIASLDHYRDEPEDWSPRYTAREQAEAVANGQPQPIGCPPPDEGQPGQGGCCGG